MKKLLSILLAAAVCLALAACAAEPKAEPFDREKALEFNHKIFVENQLDAILARHSSVTFRFHDPLNPDPAHFDYYYLTADASYSECKISANYCEGYLEYMARLQPDDSGQPSATATVIAHLDEDYERYNTYQVPLEDEDLWFRRDVEDVTGMRTSQDGFTVITTTANEEGSRQFFEEYLYGRAYEGQTVRTEIVAYADSGEIVTFTQMLDKDGVTEQVFTMDVAYDEPEPRACAVLRACLNEDSLGSADVRFTVDPGTEKTRTLSFTVPYGHAVAYTAERQVLGVYTDEACTQPVTRRWDRMSDLELYFVLGDPAE